MFNIKNAHGRREKDLSRDRYREFKELYESISAPDFCLLNRGAFSHEFYYPKVSLYVATGVLV